MKRLAPKHLVPGVLLLLLCLYVGALFLYREAYAGQILPGVSVGSVAIGGLPQEEALLRIRTALAPALAQQDLVLDFPDPKQDTATPLAQMIQFREEVGSEAAAIGRSVGAPYWYAPFLLRFAPYTIPTESAIQINREALLQTLEKSGTSAEVIPATISYSRDATTGAFAPLIIPERDGYAVDIQTTVERMASAIALGRSSVEVAVADYRPASIRTSDLEPLIPTATQWLKGPVTLVRDTETLTLNTNTIGDLFSVTSTADGYALTLDQPRLANFFDGQAFTATSAPQDGWIRLTPSSTVEDLRIPTRGQVVNIEATKKNIEAALARSTNRQAKLEVETRYGVFTGPDAERLGIRELIGKGDSDFSGSPTNRRKNIALGAERLHAVIIPPGGVFSTMSTLGPITGEAGWLPELVIKGNQTIPEFGGGLCQIGTTAFRAALQSGLPIVERRNHSYRVRYYEPAGTDATLYDPAPDFKFKNDSAHHLLITKDLKQDTVSFLYWGTRDGRVASTTTPTVTNIIQPPPKKLIETTDLKPGEVKCTESAHAGATASFNYSVQYADGRQATSTFRSVYRPWQAVCLVGVEKLSSPNAVVTGPDETGLNNPG